MNTQTLPKPATPATPKRSSLDTYQPPAATVLDWLRSNLGNRALAPLTGTDTKLLRAAVQIMEAYGYDRAQHLVHAFGLVVSRMQQKNQWLAFHAIAHPLDWSDRPRIFNALTDAKILKPLGRVPMCSFEPGGSYRDMTEEGGAR